MTDDIHNDAVLALQLHSIAQDLLGECFLWSDFLNHVAEEDRDKVLDEMMRITLTEQYS